ncbi:TonB-dependent receptor [Maribacter ulvicola]|uniref:TonB-linked outer membrane protein, SusC/RagA family n=1 Tax=Maribacter ulvicola TaxID=228959 RepID=A0A1N6Y9B7_9FLAO|nr:TonB-dependent receptor [Maribacter ulvicola]SIR11163.1 TonB-linked outer membrane protein, SusC/RagA family [Maribacter ulvicola]
MNKNIIRLGMICSVLFPNISLKMKLTTLFLILVLFRIQANTYSQNTKITLDLESVGVMKVFKEIEAKSEFKFLGNQDVIDKERLVSIHVKNQRIEKILTNLFQGTHITFKTIDRQIILKKEKPKIELKDPPIHNSAKQKQQHTISGTVVDIDGTPLPGANILEKGTTNGTQADFDGNFSLAVSNEEAILTISYIGFAAKEVAIKNQKNLNVVLQESADGLDEVVVVGYGTEIKRNLTSAVASVSTEELQDIPATSLSNAIAGRLAGVSISSAGGRPGTTAGISIRGATTGPLQGSSAPLYVIDNVIATKELFDLLGVNEVESVSVLKDAAASAVYGARASNGVILVTTKRGQPGKPVLTFNTSIGTSKVSRDVQHTTAYEHSLLINQAVRAGSDPLIPNSQHGTVPISDVELEYLKNNPFPNFLNDVEIDPLVKNYTANISGASDVVDYFIAGSYIDESGSLKKLNYNKSNLRANIGVKLSENLKISLTSSLATDNDYQYYWPFDSNNDNLFDGYRQAGRRGNWAPTYINGLPVANFNAFHIGDYMDQAGAGDRTRKTNLLNYTVDIDYKVPFLKGLSAGITYNNRKNINTNTTFRKPHTSYFFAADPNNQFLLTDEITGTRTRLEGGSDGNSIYKDNNTVISYQLNARLNYDYTVGDHNIKAGFIYEQWEADSDFFWVRRRNLLTTEIQQLFATSNDAEDRNGNGSEFEEGRLSYIGTLGYTFKNKYFINGSFRYDGSVRFEEENRYGFFPSVSTAWIVSEESFFNDNLDFIDFFKIRASLGLTGSDAVTSTFSYLEGFQASGSTVFGNGNNLNTTIVSRGIASTGLTWDKTKSFNIGADFEFLQNRLSTTVEVFKNKRSNLFGPRQSTVPVLIGTGLPPENYGAVDVEGFEVLTNYKNKIGNVSYNIGANIGYSKNRVTTFDESDALRDYERQLGTNTGRIFGYRNIGMVRTQSQLDELIATGYTFENQTPYIGSLIYEDIRGNSTEDPQGNTPDGVIDRNDRDVIGQYSSPPINYGITLGFTYKDFSFNAFVQGFEGHERVVPDNGRFYFDVISEGGWAHWNDAFDPVDNPDGKFPRFTRWGTNGNPNFQTSSFWLQKAGFARLKNLNISYNLPQTALQTVGVKQAKLYFNGTNLFFLYSTIKEYDPEISSGAGIPINKTYSLGLQITL